MNIPDLLDNHLISGWRNAFRLRIMQLHLFITGLGAALYNLAKAYPDMAQQVLAKIPPELLHPVVVNTALLIWMVVGAYARLVPQNIPPNA